MLKRGNINAWTQVSPHYHVRLYVPTQKHTGSHNNTTLATRGSHQHYPWKQRYLGINVISQRNLGGVHSQPRHLSRHPRWCPLSAPPLEYHRVKSGLNPVPSGSHSINPWQTSLVLSLKCHLTSWHPTSHTDKHKHANVTLYHSMHHTNYISCT